MPPAVRNDDVSCNAPRWSSGHERSAMADVIVPLKLPRCFGEFQSSSDAYCPRPVICLPPDRDVDVCEGGGRCVYVPNASVTGLSTMTPPEDGPGAGL
jgi:hypothetical protein